MTDPLLLPQGCRLIHIGPHKTGTTAVQWAFHNARAGLQQQGAHYAHDQPQAYLPAIALTGRPGRAGGPQVDDVPWLELVKEIEDVGDRRVVVSSESFSNAATADIERLADDLGRDRVHIVRMLRRYDKMLPSQWQQLIAGGGRQSFATYLERVQTDPEHAFWRRHGFANLTQQWSDVVGPENVTTVVVDEGDHDWLLRVFERFVGLTEGTLQAQRDRSNRSLTRGEVELLRRVNIIRDAQEWADKVHYQYVRLAASPAMRRMPPDPDGGGIAVPAELHPMLVEATERDLSALVDLGVRIVGDTALLSPPTPEGLAESAGPAGAALDPTVGVDSAAAAVAGVISRAEARKQFPLRDDSPRERDETDEDAGNGSGNGAAEEDDEAVEPAVPVPALRRGTRLVVVPPAGPEGARLRAALAAASDELAAAKHPCQVVDHVEDVRGRRVHVVLVALPPRQVLSGRWQEHVLSREATSYADWQPGHLEEDPLAAQLSALVKRVGAKRVSVVIANAFEPSQVLRTLEQLADLDPGTLEDRAAPRAVLGWSEAELLRLLDADLREDGRDQAGWDRYVRDGVLPWLLSAPPTWLDRVHPLDEATAAWVRRESQRMVEALEGSGIRVIGNVGRLRRSGEVDADVAPGQEPAAPRIRPGAGALAVIGAIAAADPDA